MQDAQVYKSNALVEASYRLSVAEQRIILACIAQVRRDQPLNADSFYSVSVADIVAMTGSSSGSIYTELEQAALRLRRREVSMRGLPNGEYLDEVEVFGWVDTIRYSRKAGRVRLRFHRSMVPYLSQLTEQFTRYQLSAVAKMTSAHAIRMFELLAQYGSVGQREVSVEQLRDWFQLEDRYPLMADLRRWVIEPAVAQVNEHSPLVVKWEQRKTGRKVTHLLFTFAPKKTKAAIKAAEKPQEKRKAESKADEVPGFAVALAKRAGLTPAQITKKARPGETWEQAAARLAGERAAPEPVT
jgi:plasmid replication initiation protein